MDPRQLMTIDKRLVWSIRGVGLIFSLVLASVLVLINRQVLAPSESYYTFACLPLAAGFVAIGLALVSWEPYTLRKVKLYTAVYAILGALTGTLVIGFSSFSFLCWLLLLATMAVYLRAWATLSVYLLMNTSLLAWVLLHPDLQVRGHMYEFLGSSLAVGAIAGVILGGWQLMNKAVRKLEDSHTREVFAYSQLTSLVNSMADGVIAVDEQARVTLYNAAALNILDSNSSMQDKSVGEFLKPLTQDNASIDIVNFILNTRTPTINRDLRIKYGDGSFANLYLAVAPVHLGFGQTGKQGFVVLLRDITREKSLEEERDEFISVVSHELRTPIAISEGNISNAQVIVEKSGDTKAVKQALEEAHNQIVFLAGMVNDLATLSRAERGKLILEIEAINVKEFMAELASNYQAAAGKKQLTLKTHIDNQVTELHSSKLYVREVLQNFITNAIKYTEKGSVSISARAQEKGILFSVTDSGIGISKADQERVFDKFFRSEDYRTRQNSGTGLGLYVTMKLAHLIHADITLDSKLNKGSTFSIFIPNLVE